MKDVAGKVAFITGGSSGIGLGIALAFARAGMHVVAAGRRQGHLAEAAARFAAEGLRVRTMQVDVTDADAVERAAARTQELLGRVHVLVNNAGVGLIGPVAQASRSDWDWIIDVNIKGVAHGLQAFLPRIRAHGEGGHIVSTASMGGLLPVSAGLYCLTKLASSRYRRPCTSSWRRSTSGCRRTCRDRCTATSAPARLPGHSGTPAAATLPRGCLRRVRPGRGGCRT